MALNLQEQFLSGLHAAEEANLRRRLTREQIARSEQERMEAIAKAKAESDKKTALEGLYGEAEKGQLTPESLAKFMQLDPKGAEGYRERQAASAFFEPEGGRLLPGVSGPEAPSPAVRAGIDQSLSPLALFGSEGIKQAVELTKMRKPKEIEAGSFAHYLQSQYGDSPNAQQMEEARKKWLSFDNKPAAPPTAGSFEDFVIRKHGPSATADQILAARGEWEGAKKPLSENDKVNARKLIRGSFMTLDRLDRDLERINQMPLWRQAGLYGANLPSIRGAESASTRSAIEGLKHKLAVIAMQNMREASRTGGAVGQVTEKEWGFLAQSIANLDPDRQTIGELKNQLDEVGRFISDTRKFQNDNYRDVTGEDYAPTEPEKRGTYAPGTKVTYKGKNYTVGEDGDTLIPE